MRRRIQLASAWETEPDLDKDEVGGSRGRTLESLTLRQNANNPPEVTGDENSYAGIDDLRTVTEMPIIKG